MIDSFQTCNECNSPLSLVFWAICLGVIVIALFEWSKARASEKEKLNWLFSENDERRGPRK